MYFWNYIYFFRQGVFVLSFSFFLLKRLLCKPLLSLISSSDWAHTDSDILHVILYTSTTYNILRKSKNVTWNVSLGFSPTASKKIRSWQTSEEKTQLWNHPKLAFVPCQTIYNRLSQIIFVKRNFLFFSPFFCFFLLLASLYHLLFQSFYIYISFWSLWHDT